MKPSSGAALLGRASVTTRALAGLAAWQEVLLLVGLGVAAVGLDAVLRQPLRLPGYQALWWMALLVIGRSTSRFRGAASISSVAAAGFAAIPFLGFGDPFIWLIYLVPGPIIDLAFWLGRPLRQQSWFAVILAGLAHASKPLLYVLISAVSGWHYGVLKYGLVFPLTYHIAFGLLGGLIGVGLVWLGRRALRPGRE